MCEIVFGLLSTGNVPTKLLHISLCLCCLKTVVKCLSEEKDPGEYGIGYGEATGKEQTGKGVAAFWSAYSLQWSAHTNGVEISTYNASWQTSEPCTCSCPRLAILLHWEAQSLLFIHTTPTTVKQASSLFQPSKATVTGPIAENISLNGCCNKNKNTTACCFFSSCPWIFITKNKILLTWFPLL